VAEDPYLLPDGRTDFARLHEDVAFGRAGGRVIWQPRILCWYADKVFAGEELPGRFRGMRPPQIFRELAVSARVYEYNRCFRRVEERRVELCEKRLNETDTEYAAETPAGSQTWRHRRSPNSPHHITLKWPVTSRSELEVAAWRERHTSWEWDADAFEEVAAEWGRLGAPTMYMPRASVQSLYIDLMGVERAVFAIHDWPEAVEEYFRALDESHDRLIDVINASRVNIINFGDNVHAGTLSPRLFEKYVLPVYRRRSQRLHEAGKFVHAHWDGDTCPLLPFARETGLDGIEAVTPRPQGDVTLEEVKEAFGDEMFLIDGLPAIYFDETYPVSALEECTHRLLELFAPRLILGISDEISSTGDLERVEVVKQIVEEYNYRLARS